MSSTFVITDESDTANQFAEITAIEAAMTDEMLALVSDMKMNVVLGDRDRAEMEALVEMLISALLTQSIARTLDEVLENTAA